MTTLTSPFGLYVHWPFCVSKCPYCDFNSHVNNSVDHDKWAIAYEKELHRVFQESQNQTISSIFFGGGTPSLMDPKTVDTILKTAESLWGFSPDIEITLEANPTTVEIDTFANYKAAGINRLSIGIQSLHDDALKYLGRAHSSTEARFALESAQKTFDRFSFDLIYARPDQTLENWQNELKQALDIAHGHLSLYQLTIEPGTEFFKQKVQAVDEDLGADLFDLTQSIMADYKMPAYEISNHAVQGQESRHNLIYWQGDDYVGIGPGAHSRLNMQAIHQIYKPDLWIDGVFHKGSGEQKRKPLDRNERAVEMIMMGLRLSEGISKEKFEGLNKQPLAHFLDADSVALLKENDLLVENETQLKCSADGLKCLNGVLEKILL
jgi:putative oxygen-independent coproporphyrinogen III oxidase